MMLFIAEKKSMGQAIADQLGIVKKEKGYFDCGDTLVTWALGHLLEQQSPDAYIPDDCPRSAKGVAIWRSDDLPIVPDVWLSRPISDKKAQLAIIGKLLKKAKLIVNAGDIDREGQALVDNVIDYHKCKKPVKRFWVSSADPTAIQRGLDNLMDNKDYSGWRDASIARSRADWLIGMNITRAMTLEAKKDNVSLLLVAGRVQSPTLNLVVERDRTIANFKAIDHFGVKITVDHAVMSFKAEWVAGDDSPGLDPEGRLVDKGVAASLMKTVKGAEGTISNYESTVKTTPAPLGLSLSQVTLIAANKYGYTSDEILKTCQSLYERKILSYPRTDNSYLPDSQYDDRVDVIEAIKSTLPQLSEVFGSLIIDQKTRIWNSSKTSAHHAIIPTVVDVVFTSLSELEQRVYTIVGSNYLSHFLPVEKYKSTKIELTCKNEKFVAKGKNVIELGWLALYKDNEESAPIDSLPEVSIGDKILASDVEGVMKKTKPPGKFNEGTLIAAMENIHKYIEGDDVKRLLKNGDGIGQPSSRSNIIKELRKREFLVLNGKSIVSTPLGQALIDNMPKRLKSPTLTALYERELMQIQETGIGLDKFVTDQENLIKELMKEINLDVEKLRPFAQSKKKVAKKRASKRRGAKPKSRVVK